MAKNKLQKNTRSQTVLEVRDISKKYRDGDKPKDILHKVKFSVFAQDFVGIIGPSGSGKSTLLNCLVGLENPDEGLIYFNERNFSELTPGEKAELRGKEMSFVFRENNLVEYLSVQENLALKLQLSGVGGMDVKRNVDDVVDEFDIRDLLKKNVKDLTKYEAQLISLAVAFVNSPKIIFLDEPTGELSSKEKDDFLDRVVTSIKLRKVAVVIFSHDSQIAMRVSKVIRIDNGKII